MRRSLVAVLMLSLLLLSACTGGGNETLQAPMKFRTTLMEAGGCSFTAQIRADVQQRLFDMTLQCDVKTDGSAEITVLAPETIEGVQVQIRGGSGLLSYDTLSLEFGLLEDTELAPIELPAVMVDCWQGAYIASAGGDEGLTHVSYDGRYHDTSLVLDAWFDADGKPAQTELSLHGKVVAVIKLTDFSLHGG